METQQEAILTIKNDGEIVAIVYHDHKKRSQVFYKVEEMNQEDIKNLLSK